MASRKGTLLEKNVQQLLKLSGFNPELNKIYKGYEIDVFVNYGNLKIAFECKQYERSTLAIRNLIHQWESKNGILKFDKVVLVLVGCDISNRDYNLAKDYNLVIWNEPKLISLMDSAIQKKTENKGRVLNELGIKAGNISLETKPKIIRKRKIIQKKPKTPKERLEELEDEESKKYAELQKALIVDNSEKIQKLKKEIKGISNKIKMLWETM